MRLVLLTVALGVAWYYFADLRNGLVDATLREVKDTAAAVWSAVPKPGQQAQQALRDTRQRSAILEAELSRASEDLARAEAEATARETSLSAARNALKAREAAESAAIARAEALGAQLATARQASSHLSETLQTQMAENEAQAIALRRDNGLLQDRLNGAAAQSAADDAARASLQRDLQAAMQGSQRQQEQCRRLASDLEHLREISASQIADLRKQLDGAKGEQAAKAKAMSTPPAGAPPDAHGTGVSMQATRDGAGPVLPEPLATPPRDTLVEGIRTHVVVRFTADDPPAKARALKLGAALQAQGMLIEQIVGSPSRLQADSLSYFYKSDESRAGLVATLFPEFRSTMRLRPPEDRIPRPGLIEIEVAT